MKYCRSCRTIEANINDCQSSDSFEIEQKRDFPDGYEVSCTSIKLEGRLFRITGFLGKGGLGTVFEVTCSEGNRFALKVPFSFEQYFTTCSGKIEEEMDASATYLNKEISIINSLTEKGLDDDMVLKVFYAGKIICTSDNNEHECGGILMEIAEGTLKDLIGLEANGTSSIEFSRKSEIISELLFKLEKIHNKDTVHRDISPANIFIVERGRKLSFVFGDFGNAKEKLACLTHTRSSVAGTPMYSDPARYLFEDYRKEFSIDIYAMAVIAVEFILGETAAEEYLLEPSEPGSYFSDYFTKIASGLLPDYIYSVLKRALVINPELREYRTVSGFGKSLIEGFERRVEELNKKRYLKLPLMVDVNYPLPSWYNASPGTVFTDSCLKLRYDSAKFNVGVRCIKIKVEGPDFIDAEIVGEEDIELKINRDRFSELCKGLGDDITGRLVFGGLVQLKRAKAG